MIPMEDDSATVSKVCRVSGFLSKNFFFFSLFVVNIYLRYFSSYTSSSNLLFLPSISDELALCIAVIGINFEYLELEIRFFIFLAHLLKHFFFLLILQHEQKHP